MNANHDIAWPSISKIQGETGLSRPTVIKYLDELENRQFIQRDKVSRTSTTYIAIFPKAFQDRLNSLTSKGALLVKELNQTSKGALPEVVKEVYPNKQKNITKNDTNISSSVDEHFVDTFFSKVWNVWPKKQNRQRAEKSWHKLLKGKSEQHVQDFTEKLIENINARVTNNEFGFSSMLFSSYLNGQRWEDEIAQQEQPKENRQPMWQIVLENIKQNKYESLSKIPYGYQKMVNDARKDGFINDADWAVVQQFAKEKRYA